MRLYAHYFIWLVTAWPGQAAPSARAAAQWDESHGFPPYGYQCAANHGHPLQPPNGQWQGWGADSSNNRWASAGAGVNSANAASLAQTCSMQYAHGVSATATVLGDIAYYPTWSGLYVALNYITCTPVWQINVTTLALNFGPVQSAVFTFLGSRTSAAIDGNVLYFGTLAHALVVAVDLHTGTIIDQIQINDHPFALITQSPTVWQGILYIGVASAEESVAAYIPGYKCCSFVGNFDAITLRSGKLSILWTQYMVPPGTGWSGVAVWGSQPSIDPARGQVFIATGNVYSLPQEFSDCQDQTANITVIQQGLGPDPCTPRNVYVESVLALDLRTGFVNWALHVGPLDAFSVACIGLVSVNPAGCPPHPGPDADFGIAPTFVPGSTSTPHGQDTLVVGQKNGNLYAISAQAGTIFWALQAGPGGISGGLMWGLAVDDSTIYYTATNSEAKTWQLQPSGTTIKNSAFGAASLATGKILWQTQAPNNSLSFGDPSIVNDVILTGWTAQGSVYTGTGGLGGMVALQKTSGAIIKDYPLTNQFYANTAIANGHVFFGTGYRGLPGNGSFNVWKA